MSEYKLANEHRYIYLYIHFLLVFFCIGKLQNTLNQG